MNVRRQMCAMGSSGAMSPLLRNPVGAIVLRATAAWEFNGRSTTRMTNGRLVLARTLVTRKTPAHR
jgi:hypothetical protein